MRLLRQPAWVIIAALLAAGCNNVFYYPSQERFAEPEAIGLPYTGVFFESLDGTRLHGWFFPAARAAGEPPPPVIIQFHGNAENITSHFRSVAWLARSGFNVFVFDYRGYGASAGRPGRAGIQRDALAAIRYVRSRPDVDPGRLVLFGQSVGGAIAITAAVAAPEGVRAVIAESAFASYRGIAREKLGSLWFTWPLQWPLSFLVTDAFSPVEAIGRLAPIPVLIVHGTNDPVVPFHHAEALMAAAGEPKTLWAVFGDGHIGAFTRYGAVYRPALLAYLRGVLEPGSQPVAP
jgi:fermentation-respiration switch protein FrsA (DUF1100 family)